MLRTAPQVGLKLRHPRATPDRDVPGTVTDGRRNSLCPPDNGGTARGYQRVFAAVTAQQSRMCQSDSQLSRIFIHRRVRGERPQLPPTERSAGACARAARFGHHPYRSLHDSQAVRGAPPARSRWTRRSLRRVAGEPDGNARSAADRRGFAVEVGLTGDGADRGDLFAARKAAGARRPAGPGTAGGLALRVWITSSCGCSGCRC